MVEIGENASAASVSLRSAAAGWIPVAVVAAGLLAVWTLVVWVGDLPPSLLPTPWQCVAAAWVHRESLMKGFVGTGAASLAGMALALVGGIVIGVVFSWSRWLRRAMFPYVMFLQTVPIVAIAPLLIIWSGYRFRTVVIVTAMVCLFPIVNAVLAGLSRPDTAMNDLFSIYGAGRWRRLVRLQWPAAFRDLVVGLQTASGLAVIGAIVAEFFVGNGTAYDGLGTLMSGWQAMMRTDALVAAIAASTGLGLLLYGGIAILSWTILRRYLE